MDFTIYTTEDAPEGSKEFLKGVKEDFGFIPNLLGEFAESPAALEGYLTLNGIVEKTGFSPVEQQLAILAVSVENKCHYCSAIHSAILKNQLGADAELVEAVRNQTELPDPKLNELVNYVRTVVQKRGFAEDAEIERFLNAGYSKGNLLDVNVIIALKTISNYTNHIADTPLDEPFRAEQIEFAAKV